MARHSMPDSAQLAKALTPFVRELLLEEVRKVAARRDDEPAKSEETEIMAACLAVARASDRLAQARFAGRPEISARMAIIRASDVLARTMRKHGRMPRGE